MRTLLMFLHKQSKNLKLQTWSLILTIEQLILTSRLCQPFYLTSWDLCECLLKKSMVKRFWNIFKLYSLNLSFNFDKEYCLFDVEQTREESMKILSFDETCYVTLSSKNRRIKNALILINKNYDNLQRVACGEPIVESSRNTQKIPANVSLPIRCRHDGE